MSAAEPVVTIYGNLTAGGVAYTNDPNLVTTLEWLQARVLELELIAAQLRGDIEAHRRGHTCTPARAAA